MPKSYASTHEVLTQIDIPDDVLTSIGRLVRACAEIEDLVTLYICRLTGISQSHAVVLLGRTMISKRLDIVHYLAQMVGQEISDLTKKVFNAQMADIFECRNAVAHGTFLGITAGKEYAFLTARTITPEGPSAIQIAVTYTAETIAATAEAAHSGIPQVISLLGLGPLRDKRLGQALAPHRKGLSPRTP